MQLSAFLLATFLIAASLAVSPPAAAITTVVHSARGNQGDDLYVKTHDANGEWQRNRQLYPYGQPQPSSRSD